MDKDFRDIRLHDICYVFYHNGAATVMNATNYLLA